MAIKEFLTYQSEPAITGSIEKGIQLRASDPFSPISNQLWINTTEGNVKINNAGNITVISETYPVGYTLPALAVDATNGISFKSTISANSTYTFSNFVTGSVWNLIITNTDISSHTLTFPAAVKYQSPTLDPVVNAGATVYCKFVQYDDNIYCIITK